MPFCRSSQIRKKGEKGKFGTQLSEYATGTSNPNLFTRRVSIERLICQIIQQHQRNFENSGDNCSLKVNPFDAFDAWKIVLSELVSFDSRFTCCLKNCNNWSLF